MDEQLWEVSTEDIDGNPYVEEFYSYQEAIDFCNDEGIEISEIKEVLL